MRTERQKESRAEWHVVVRRLPGGEISPQTFRTTGVDRACHASAGRRKELVAALFASCGFVTQHMQQ